MDTEKDTIAIVILAAGASKRMGQPKQLLKWKHTTLLGNAIEEALSITGDVMVVLGANSEEIKKHIKNKPIGIVFNVAWQKGMGTSIALGVSKLIGKKQYDGILIMVADQPLLDALFFKRMVSVFKEKHAKIVATAYGDTKGVPALFDQSLFPELLQLNQDFGARKLMKAYGDQIIGMDADGKTMDIDTQEDYDDLSKSLH